LTEGGGPHAAQRLGCGWFGLLNPLAVAVVAVAVTFYSTPILTAVSQKYVGFIHGGKASI
jgi:hypothetical protein